MSTRRLEIIGRGWPFFRRKIMTKDSILTYQQIKKLNQHKPVTLKNGTYIEPEIKNFPISDFADPSCEIKDPPVPLSVPKLIKLLHKHHNISFTKSEEALANSTIPYSGYSALATFALDKGSLSFTDVYALYNIDRYLRSSISRLMPSIETTIKNHLSRAIVDSTDNKDAFIYEKLNCDIWRKDKKKPELTKNWIAFSFETISDIQSKRSSLQRSLKKYNGHLPIWLLLDNLTFGSISLLLPLLNKDLVFDTAKNLISTPSPTIYSLCQALVILRNAVYHNTKVLGTKFNYSITLDKQIKALIISDLKPVFPQKNETQILDDINHRLFIGLLSMKFFYSKLPTPEIEKWNTFILKFQKKVNANNTIKTNLTSIYMFPQNWENILYIKDTIIYTNLHLT